MSGRFAPTPSGRMHIGNVYAMLAAWLSARSQPQGRIALRIEDIDTPRVVPDADRLIMDDLAWLGLDWDGDPVYQSRRDDLYREAFRTLRGDGGLGESRVFPCFCSRADIRAASAPQEGDGFSVYPGTCRRRWADDPDDVRLRLERGDRHAWRVAVPAVGHAGDDGDSGKNRSDGCDCCDVSGGNNGNTGDMGDSVTFQDRVFGPQRFVLSRDVGDAVVLRSDGLFSYQLAVVVDDLLMGVDDIVRGRDLLPSTALQMWIRRLLLDRGFGADAAGACPVATTAASAATPMYAHLPLVDDRAHRRLAKRERSYDLGMLRSDGVEPEQIIGYCAWMLGLCDDGESSARGERSEHDEGLGHGEKSALDESPTRQAMSERDQRIVHDDGEAERVESLPMSAHGEPRPMSAREALAAFSWEKVARVRRDHVLRDPAALGRIGRI
ncbi:glutamate--tRNA ligase family protein [Bifidobacterium mongoliense]|uniref:Glutamyl-Q tRNA(Asp) synthetase n=1 Tax=Bifidobacterium mongoliense TaxID=518643 RepID=A0A423UCS1_9BIFI|nr:glutamate--tRNA ligase family protein [Bifidobacterium mongoliense]MDN5632781.1 glutamate--tRNA ligase family protein [Bifidobacterium mongoliense]MDN5979804.1 glutamate--tRNA ligase family protein [Bifidobacterium mongoliense]MDN6024783.1 glutamate--tRNA ligase family protein [Bifidobacterium mongoliense]MDN6050830.1 glutamate--tRNA ligase family protein [Bifidobacterium mongoliense]MDN6553642.1 glutamate--tRNA ligase family protein [Bifidobacterium mongoliense]